MVEIYKIEGSDEPYDIDKLNNYDFKYSFYWYRNEGYEGYGLIVLYKQGLWFVHDLGHCSCYSPLENLDESMRTSYNTYIEIKNKFTTGMYVHYELDTTLQLFELIEKTLGKKHQTNILY